MASRFDRGLWLRRARNAAIALAGLLLIVGIAGFFVLPGIVKSVAQKQIAEQLGRKATIGDVRLNPYLLSATIDDFRLYEPDGTSVAVEVRSLFADISSASLWKRALVFDELRVAQPTIRVARLDAGRSSFSDVADRLASKPKPESESPFQFSINNIQLDGGVIDVDDRVTNRKHHVDGIRVALPFLSNLPYDTAIFVTPEFAARVDGSAIALTGKAQPFSTSREAALDLDVTDLDLTEYVDLSPARLPFTLASGKVAAKLALRFNAATTDADGKSVPQSMTVSGRVGLASVDLTDKAGRSAIKAKTIDVDITKIDPFGGEILLERVAIADAHIDATRRADGSIDLLDLFKFPPSGSTAPAPAATPAKAPIVAIAAFKIDNASVRFADQTLQTPATTQLKNISVDAGGIVLSGATPTTFRLALVADDDARLEIKGTAVVEKREVSGTVDVKGFRPGRLAPYLASALAARIDDGSVDVGARFRIDASGPRVVGLVDEIVVRVDRLRTSLPDEKTALLGADGIALDGGRFDLATREFSADSLKLVAPVVAIRRDAKGRLNLKAALVEAGPAGAPKAAVKVEPDAAQPFTAVVKSVIVERGDVAFEDLSVGTPVRVRAQPFNLKAENIGTAADAVVPFVLDTGIEKRGKLSVDGRVALSPMTLDATLDASQVPVGWLAAYSGNRLNVSIERADLDAKGTVRVAEPKGGNTAGTAPLAVSYRGSLGISRMRALDKTTSEEFMQWKTLEIPKVEVEMPAKNAPLAVTLGTVTLSDFYARVIVNANGRLNLQDVVAVPGQQQSVTTPEAQPTAAPAPAPGARAVPAGKPSSDAKPLIRVAGVRLAKGRIGITDNFIKPNYSANLTDLGGEVSAIASDDAKPADLKLTGRIDGEGVLEVGGKVNPFATTLYTDLSAEAKDIELTRLTPYAVKYAGYAIERGKLSMTVKYHIEDGKLDAQNRLFLDQLTFGEKVDSPTATKLPVLLAVSLLKNSRGEIDVNLPISGSLSDPEFSIGGVLARVIVNLLTRAITSPFSLIAAAVGGGGSAGELGYVQFQPGVSEMTAQGKAKLETLAKALAERPALRLDIIGRFDPATDPDGIKRDHLLDRLKDLKAKEQSKAGDRVGRNEVTIEPNEYATWLARVYDDTKLPDKPRNVIGLAKTIPVEEMEKLLLANIKLDDNDPRWLAEARADVVRHYIEDTGKVAASRVFLVTPKLNANGIDDKGVPNRVDFALR